MAAGVALGSGCPTSPVQLSGDATGGADGTMSSAGDDASGSQGASAEEDGTDATSGPRETDPDEGTADDTSGSDSDSSSNGAPSVDDVSVLVDGVRVELTIQSSDPDGDALTLYVDWGDSDSVEVANAAASEEVGHEYRIPASYDIEVHATDVPGTSSTAVMVQATSQVPSGAIAYFPFDGDTDDTLGNSVVADGVVEFDVDRFNLGNSALSLDRGNASGEGVLVSMPTPGGITGAFSVSVWVEMDNGCGVCGNDVRFAGIGDWFNLYSNGSGLRFGDAAGDGSDDAVDAVTPPVGEPEWHHYVGVLEEVNPATYALRLYRDGNEFESIVSDTIPLRPACRFYMGTYPGGSRCTDTQAAESQNFQGDLDDVRLYPRALSELEVAALFHERGY